MMKGWKDEEMVFAVCVRGAACGNAHSISTVLLIMFMRRLGG